MERVEGLLHALVLLVAFLPENAKSARLDGGGKGLLNHLLQHALLVLQVLQLNAKRRAFGGRHGLPDCGVRKRQGRK